MTTPHRPRRYPGNQRLSRIVDQLTVEEEALQATGDPRNAARLRKARNLIVDVALGVPPEER